MKSSLLIIISLLLFSIPAFAQTSSKLDDAYQKEIHLLKKEKQQLLKKIEKAQAKSINDIKKLRKHIGTLSEKVTRYNIENEALEENLHKSEELLISGDDKEALLYNTLEQIEKTLRRHPVKIQAKKEDPELFIKESFLAGCNLANKLGNLRVERGTYYKQDGSEVKSEILWIGSVGAFGLDQQNGGMLGPVDINALKVIAPNSVTDARNYTNSKATSLMETYLFDPLDKTAGASEEKSTLWQTFLSGGFVMWPILILGIVALLILLERLWVLKRVHTNADKLMSIVGNHIAKGNWGDAFKTCQQKPGAVARVIGIVLRHRKLPRIQHEELVNESILAERPTLERFLPALNVIAAVAPLLGLLGTVTGMIGTFHVITTHGTGDPRLLSGGISEALLTTQFGLMLAIPVLLVHTLLVGRVDHILTDMETNALKLLNLMHVETNGADKKFKIEFFEKAFNQTGDHLA